MDSFKIFFEQANDSWKRFRKDKHGMIQRVVHRHTADMPDPTMGINRQAKNAGKFVPQYVRQQPRLTGNGDKQLTINQARSIAKKHNLNLGTITKKGKVLRGTRPKEVLLLNPDTKSPFPYIKRVIK